MHSVLIDIPHMHECLVCPIGSQADSACDSWSGTNWTDSFYHSIVQQYVSDHDETVHKFLGTVSLWIVISLARSICKVNLVLQNNFPTCHVQSHVTLGILLC